MSFLRWGKAQGALSSQSSCAVASGGRRAGQMALCTLPGCPICANAVPVLEPKANPRWLTQPGSMLLQ